MNPSRYNKLQWTGTILRLVIGILFIYMGAQKAMDPAGFLKLVRQYNLPLEYWMLNTIAATLPWFEVFCGVMLVTGVAVRGTSLITFLMLVPFTITVAFRAMDIATLHQIAYCAVKFDCGCGAGEVYVCAKIVENLLLMAGAALLLVGHGRPLAFRYSLVS